jgi:hypothetical protein
VTPVLQDPKRWDLPCLWFDPIPVDRDLPLGAPVTWREYEIGVHELPGHTLYAAAYAFEADGRRIVATGDQQTTEWRPGEQPEVLNYQYRNRFRIDDFRRSAELYRALNPELMISGHWTPRKVTPDYLDMLLEEGERVARLHRELLPPDIDFDAEGFGARITPYRSAVEPGRTLVLEVCVRNPFPTARTARVRMVLPRGWAARPAEQEVKPQGGGEATLVFEVTVPRGESGVRRRVAADLTVGRMRFGQQAEALVTVAPRRPRQDGDAPGGAGV